jgi:hypothetical protein
MESFVDAVLPALMTLLTALVSWGCVELTKMIREKTKNEKVTAALQVVTDVVESTVKKLAQTADQLAADGKIDAADKRQLKNLALTEIKGQLPEASKKLIGMAVSNVDSYIDSLIETEVYYLKK